MRLDRKDQDLIDQLSDMAGPLRPGEKFNPYMSAYPLPSSEYYVLARTEQDFDAPRAGCVKTRSLLVPQRYWENKANPAILARLLDNLSCEGSISFPQSGAEETLPSIQHPMLVELVEALFLQDRRAIVVFDAPEPRTIALRLLLAFWPIMRRNFSLCTFALSPRTLAGRSFDLIFAPVAARSRFSDCKGRRIVSERKREGESHRWARRIEKAVFWDEKASLIDLMNEKALVGDQKEVDEKFLHISLVWSDLLERVPCSPTAVLGMIDIATSRNAVESSKDVLEPTISSAVEVAAKSMNPEQAWTFFETLIQKSINLEFSNSITRSLEYGVRVLARRNWQLAIHALVKQVYSNNYYDQVTGKAIADELADINFGKIKKLLTMLAAGDLLRIVLLNDRLVALSFSVNDEEKDTTLIDSMTQGWRSLDKIERAAHGMRLVVHIKGNQDFGLLAMIVEGMQSDQLIEALELLWNRAALRSEVLGKLFCDAVVGDEVRKRMRAVFARLGGGKETDVCIGRLLAPLPEDMTWVINSAEMECRRLRVLKLYIAGSNKKNMVKAFSTKEIAIRSLDLLASDLDQCASAAAKLIVLPIISPGVRAKYGLDIYKLIKHNERFLVGQSLAQDAFMEAREGDADEINRILETIIEDIDFDKLVETVFDFHNDGEQVSAALVMVSKIPRKWRSRIKDQADRIVYMVASRAEFDLTGDAARSLANLVEDTKSLGVERHVQICSKILTFAVSAPNRPASQIVIAAFPTVHESLRGAGEYFGLIPFFMVSDWDRARTVRKDLVRTFLSSEWPPVDLAVVAYRAKALRSIFKRLIKEPRGRKYLDEIEKGTRRLKKSMRNPILKAIKETRGAGK